jgi:putative serine protease PepD
MNEEQSPVEGPHEQDPDEAPERAPEQLAEQPTAPVHLEHTIPLASYPPPTGGPFVHQPPPPPSSTFAQQPPPPVVPVVQQPPPPVGLASVVASGGHPSAPWLPVPEGSMASPATSGLPDRPGLGGLGAGVVSTIVAGALAIAIVAALFGGVIGALLVSRRDGGSATLSTPPAGSTARPAGSIADIAARILPSVVTIKVKGPNAEGTGSGFVLRQDGYILTNNHVVTVAANSGTITVLFSDGKSADAKIIGRDESYDLAVIRVDRSDLPVLALGVSSAVVVGDEVIAVGAPLGLDSTVTSGIVSALNRPVTAGGAGDSTSSFINAIQTDAAINPGNSGGPLLDMAGRVIGVNSAIARVASSDSPFGGQSGNIGVGFAIPSDQARKTAEQLIASGKATHPVIGVMIDTAYTGEGVKIATAPKNGSPPISKGGPADKAGLKPGDVILKFAGRVVTGPDEFVVAIRARSVGDQVELTVRRGSTVRTVKMTLQAAN